MDLDIYELVINCEKVLKTDKDSWVALTNRGAAYFSLCLYEEAKQDLLAAIGKNPKAWEPYFHLGCLYHSQAKIDRAEEVLRTALTLSGGYEAVEIQLAVLLLATGRWKEGFEKDKRRPKVHNQKDWIGKDLTGQYIAAYTEGGLGDRILSLRYINSLMGHGATKVTVIGPKDLLGLIVSSWPVKVAVSDTSVDADCAVSLFDMPMILGSRWDAVPRSQYLIADRQLVKHWKHKLNLPPGLNVGLCWKSNNNTSKCLPVGAIDEFSHLPGVNIVSLQKEETAISDWSDTAALIENLDLVLSVDTGVAHLAGALGKPVWNFVKFENNWPWLFPHLLPDPHYSVWYPTMKLYRQQAFNDWVIPVRRALLDLRRKTAGLA